MRAGQSMAFQKWKCLVQEEQEPETITLRHVLRGIRALQKSMEAYDEHMHRLSDRLSHCETKCERDDVAYRTREHEKNDPHGRQADSRRKSSAQDVQLDPLMLSTATHSDGDYNLEKRQASLHRISLTDSMVLVPSHGLMKSSSPKDLRRSTSGNAAGKEAGGAGGMVRGGGAVHHVEDEATPGESFPAFVVTPVMCDTRNRQPHQV